VNADDDSIATEVESRFGAFLRERVNPNAEIRDRFSLPLEREVCREAAALGLLGFASPVASGGGGRGMADWARALEHVAYLSDDLAFCPLLCATPHFADAIFASNKPGLVLRYGHPLMQGASLAALAVYEEGADPMEVRSSARERGGSWILAGEKSLITGGRMADPFVVLVRDEASSDALVFLVSPSDPGVRVLPVPTAGARSCGFARLVLDNVELPAERMLVEADGFGFLQEFMSKRRWEEAAILTGSMRAAFDACVLSLRPRMRGGRSLLDAPNIQQELGAMYAGIESSRAMVDRVVAASSTGSTSDLGMLGTLAKHHASERALAMALALVRMQGANGYVQHHRWERYLRDILAMISAAGHQDTLLRHIGEEAIAMVERRALRARER
jgi:alkylation response protein AidB-like acyl-CoA dehydrogenase